ncbi:MAG: hypothetical protein WCT31_01250 [Candidatus Micrarchaeia archaeon]|jgi:hypothetical protein
MIRKSNHRAAIVGAAIIIAAMVITASNERTRDAEKQLQMRARALQVETIRRLPPNEQRQLDRDDFRDLADQFFHKDRTPPRNGRVGKW